METVGKQEKTKYKLAASMKECMKQMPVDKITVKNIVEGCGVARQTFYRNFLDKYDLINWYFDKLVLQSFEQIGMGHTVGESLTQKFEFIVNEKVFFTEAFRSDDRNSLKEHDFEDKTEVIHVGHEVAKELRSDKLIPDVELGVGMSYQDRYSLKKDRIAMFDQEQSGRFFVKEAAEENADMDSIPLYVTGRYKLPQMDEWRPYLKLNLGYAVNNIGGKSNSRYKSINDTVNSQNGSYYGMGGGIEYNNGLTLDLMYQVSEGSSSSDSRKDDDSRVTVSVEYKLDI